MKGKIFLVMGAVVSGLSVAIGAMGAHALKDMLQQNNRTETFELATRYAFYHGLALIVLGILWHVFQEGKFKWAGILFISGVVCFSGSLYLLSLSEMKWVVWFTPLGGMLMIGGWLLLTIHLLNMKK